MLNKYLVALLIFVALLVVLILIMLVAKDQVYSIAEKFDVPTLKDLFG